MRKVLILLLGSFLLASRVSDAGETVTSLPTSYELRDSASHAVSATKYATLAECQSAAPVPAIKYRCVETVVFDKVGTCDDVPMPVMPTIVDANGFLVLPGIVIEALPDGSWGPTKEEGFVKADYPICWVKGLVPYDGKFRAPEGPPIQDPGPWIEGVDYPLDTPCPEAAHGNCYLSPRVAP